MPSQAPPPFLPKVGEVHLLFLQKEVLLEPVEAGQQHQPGLQLVLNRWPA